MCQNRVTALDQVPRKVTGQSLPNLYSLIIGLQCMSSYRVCVVRERREVCVSPRLSNALFCIVLL